MVTAARHNLDTVEDKLKALRSGVPPNTVRRSLPYSLANEDEAQEWDDLDRMAHVISLLVRSDITRAGMRPRWWTQMAMVEMIQANVWVSLGEWWTFSCYTHIAWEENKTPIWPEICVDHSIVVKRGTCGWGSSDIIDMRSLELPEFLTDLRATTIAKSTLSAPPKPTWMDSAMAAAHAIKRKRLSW